MNYHYSRDYKAVGPVPAEQLHDLYRRGEITPETPVLPEGASEWVAYRTLNPLPRDPLTTLVPPLAGVDLPLPPPPPQAQASTAVPASSSPSYKGLVVTSWVLLAATALISLIPVIGFATWLVAVPVFLTTLILGIITLTRGGTRAGVLILIATVIVAPFFILVAPLITTAIVGAAVDSSKPGPSDATALPATATADTSSSPSENEGHKVGETIKFADSEWVVDGAQDKGSTLPGGTFAEAKRSSGKFIMVKFSVTNTSNEEEQIIDTPKLVDSKGRKFKQLDDIGFYLPDGASEMTLEQLPSGISKTFYAIYEVPRDATGLAFEARSLGFDPDYIPVSLDL